MRTISATNTLEVTGERCPMPKGEAPGARKVNQRIDLKVKPDCSSNGDEDVAAMLRLKAGDDSALNEIMNRWQKPLISFIQRYVDNYDDAVNLAEETFVRIYFNRTKYKAKGKFSSWVFTIASNLCRNHLRWRARHPEDFAASARFGTASTDDARMSESGGESPADAAVGRETARLVREAVTELPHKLKTAILLHEFQGLANHEIADILGCTEKAVESRLYRARQLLRRRLDGQL